MSFRARLFLAFLLAVGLPLGLLAYGVRREMGARLTAEYQARVHALVAVIRGDLGRESGAIGRRLRALAAALAADNRLRLAAIQGDPSARRELLDWAGMAMRTAGLDMLQLQDDAGRILSSGHFRNEFDRLEPELPRLLAAIPDTLTVVRARTPEAPRLVLARVDTFRIADRPFALVGGTAVGEHRPGRAVRGAELAVTLVLPDSVPPQREGEIVGAFTLPYLDLTVPGRPPDTARLVVTQPLTTLAELRRSLDRWVLATLAATAVLALIVAGALSARVSRPLRELAQKTAGIDLDRLDQDFATDRADEIGSLARLLGGMTERLRQSSTRLREAERRAAVGDLARQVHHDIKNGLAPIRHVLRHLAQVAEREPGALASVFAERRATLESSVSYLEMLARQYAGLTMPTERRPCDVNALVRQVLRAVAGPVQPRADLAEGLPPALVDETALRRILENLIGNAADSLGPGPSAVSVATARATAAGGAPGVRITVSDTGRGMSRAELDRAFQDFFTTKPGGTGLGLSIVRRLVLDSGGALRVATEPGVGTRVEVDLPAAEAS